MAWTIEFDDTAIRQLKKMGRSEAARVRNFLYSRVKVLDNPRLLGKAMEGPQRLWRYRVGDYRIICDIQDGRLVVLVIEIGHRSDIYR